MLLSIRLKLCLHWIFRNLRRTDFESTAALISVDNLEQRLCYQQIERILLQATRIRCSRQSSGEAQPLDSEEVDSDRVEGSFAGMLIRS